MATKLLKRVVRETFSSERGRTIMVALLPGDCVEVWEKGCHKKWIFPIKSVLHAAIKAEVAEKKRLKKLQKKGRS